MKIVRMLAGQGQGTVLRKHSFEEVILKHSNEYGEKMYKCRH